jgi:hypothetical protein
MQRKSSILLALIFLLSGLVQVSAVTLEDIAGTYTGWRTETSDAGTIRYEEIDEIHPDGSFYTWLTDPDGVVYTMYSVLTVNDDGSIGGAYSGILDINGRHLRIRAHYGADYAVHASTHRTD